MGWISDLDDEYSPPQASSSQVKITNGVLYLRNTRMGDSPNVWMADIENPLADFAFDKLPTELLVEIFHHARGGSTLDGCKAKQPYPIALTHVCRHWRNVALAAPTLWTDIRITQVDTERVLEVPRIYLERSGACPIFLTWFSYLESSHTDFEDVIDDLVIPGAERWQRITVITEEAYTSKMFLDAIEHLDFPILKDVEISFMNASSNQTLCHSAPLLRRCMLRGFPSLPPLPSNLVVFDCIFSSARFTELNLDPLLEFLPHVAHSLEHLRFGPPPVPKVQFTPRTSRIPLKHLKSLLIRDSHTIMDHIFTPGLAHFVVLCPLTKNMDPNMFEGFSAPMLQSIQFYGVPLLPTLQVHDFPSMFPHLNSITLSGCTDESTFASLLEPPKQKKPPSLQKASRHPPKQQKIQNPFPSLRELTVSDATSWTSFQAAIENRLKNGDKSLRKIQLPVETSGVILSHLRRWLPAQGIELALYEREELLVFAPEFQDDFCDEETNLFHGIMEQNELERYEEDYEDEYWEGRDVLRPDYELPAHMDPGQYWDDFYDGYDDEEEDEDEDGNEDGDDLDDFYDG